MAEIVQIFMTSMVTVFGGVLVYVGGQVSVKFFIEPIHDLRSHIGAISHALVYYSDLYTNTGEDKEERRERVSKHFRTHAALLRAKGNAVPLYGLWAKRGVIPSRKSIVTASANLIGISKVVLDGGLSETEQMARAVENELKI